jgi:hypothetical protein
MRIGIDYRSALVNREGIGRTTRELVRATDRARTRTRSRAVRLDARSGEVHARGAGPRRIRRAARALSFSVALDPGSLPHAEEGRGRPRAADATCTTTRSRISLPVRAAVEVATIFDCIYMLEGDFVSAPAAAHMTAVSREMVAARARRHRAVAFRRGRSGRALWAPRASACT